MTIFWSLAAGMLVLALLFSVPPLLRSRKSADTSLDQLNIEVVRAQLDELQADLDAGRLDQARYAAAREDLEQELLYDLSGTDRESGKPDARSGRWAAIPVALAVPLLAVWLYSQLGSVNLIDVLEQQATAPPAAQQAQANREHDMAELVDKLAQKMQSEPDSIEGWALLARSYMGLGRYDEALYAYANVRRIGGDNAGLLADYADAMVTANGGRFDDESGELLAKALELEPDNLKALWLMGHWEYSRGGYAAAIRYWQRVAAMLPADDQNNAIIDQQIAEARSHMSPDDTLTTAPAATASAAATGATITVQVELEVGLGDQVSPQDTVFVFARATQGPRMPLAVARLQVRDLPVTVTLDDSMAMTPAMKLSRFDQVTIGALVSQAGVAMPKSGDLQGTVSPVATRGGEPVQLLIDTPVP